jgi:hypothetical protein
MLCWVYYGVGKERGILKNFWTIRISSLANYEVQMSRDTFMIHIMSRGNCQAFFIDYTVAILSLLSILIPTRYTIHVIVNSCYLPDPRPYPHPPPQNPLSPQTLIVI